MLHSLTVTRASLLLAGSACLLAATACSGPTINGFTLTAGPPSIDIAPGGNATLNLAATTKNASPITATVVIYNLPPGVSYSPASPTVTTGSGTTVTLTAAATAQPATKQVQVGAFAGLAGSSVVVSVSVVPVS